MCVCIDVRTYVCCIMVHHIMYWHVMLPYHVEAVRHCVCLSHLHVALDVGAIFTNMVDVRQS